MQTQLAFYAYIFSLNASTKSTDELFQRVLPFVMHYCKFALFCISGHQKVQNLHIENVNERVSDFFLPSQNNTNKKAN